VRPSNWPNRRSIVRRDSAVPEEVAVVAVDNDQVLCDVAHPPLSSVDLSADRVGYEAAAMLDRLMRGKKVDSPVVLRPSGVVARPSTDVTPVDDADVMAALRFIRQRACDDIDVDDVAAGTALSRRTMERRFGQLLGRTPREEIVRVRIQRAKQLLTDTNWSVDQVAGKAGFQHSSYMSMLFKKQTGLTPGQYRRQAQS